MSIESRIEALERRLIACKPGAFHFMVAAVYGGATAGEPHYAWSRDDLSDMIERSLGESVEAFAQRAAALVPEDVMMGLYCTAPKLEEWGQGEKPADIVARLQAM